ncbi:MAG: hypothetical protein DIJKHBIC_01298 [Thermoanaerobaculia bacterium]|nr:hypothetical protein [Thermoanaerobaculia bacterium]
MGPGQPGLLRLGRPGLGSLRFTVSLNPRRKLAILVGILAILLALAAARERWKEPSSDPRVLLQLVLPSLSASGLAVLLAGRREAGGPPAPVGTMPRWLFLAIASLVIAGGAAVRFLGAASFPPPDGIGYEETEMASHAWELVRTGSNPFEHWLPVWSGALSFWLKGPGIPQVRIPFMILSALSSLFMLVAARRVASREIALVVTFLWAIAWWPSLAGRIADEIFFTAPLQLVALALLFAARDRGSLLAAWGAGLLCGLFLTEYTAYHAFAPIVLSAAAISLLREVAKRRRTVTGESAVESARAVVEPVLPIALAFLLSFLALALPVAAMAVKDRSAEFAEGVLRHTATEGSVLRLPWPQYRALVTKRVINLWRATHVPGSGELSPWLNRDRAPMVDPVTFALLASGLGLLLLTGSRRRHGLLLSLLLIPTAVFLTVPGNENFMRYFVVLPLAFLGAAAGLEAARGALPRPARLFLAPVLAFAAAFSVRPNLERVFVTVPSDRDTLDSYRETDIVLTAWAASREEGSRTVFLTDTRDAAYPDNDSLRWLLKGRRAFLASTLSDVLRLTPSPEEPVYVVTFGIPEIPGLEELLTRFLGPVSAVERVSSLETSMTATAWTFDLPPAGDLSRPSGEVEVRAWEAPAGDLASGTPPSPSPEFLASLRGPDFSVMALPLGVKARFLGGPQPDGSHLWASLEGVPDTARGALRAVELSARGGEAWLLSQDKVLGHLRAPNQWQGICLPSPPAGARIRLVYRHDGPGLPGVQLAAEGVDGRLRVVTALSKDPPQIRLTDLKPVEEHWGFTPPVRNLSSGGGPLVIDGITRADGLGLHAPGSAVWEVPAAARKFLAWVGLQPMEGACAGKQARLRFSLDGTPVRNFVLARGEPGHRVEIDVRGARRLEVLVEEGPDERDCDHVNLVEGSFVTTPERRGPEKRR